MTKKATTGSALCKACASGDLDTTLLLLSKQINDPSKQYALKLCDLALVTSHYQSKPDTPDLI